MTEKPTRGRRSKIDLLPEDVKKRLDALLRDSRNSQQDVLDMAMYLAELPGVVNIRLTTQHSPQDTATTVTPSLHLFHWIEDMVE